MRLRRVQRRQSELVLTKGGAQDGTPQLGGKACLGTEGAVQLHCPPPHRKDVGSAHPGVGDALGVLQVVVADVRDGNDGAHEVQVFQVEQLVFGVTVLLFCSSFS